MGGMMRFFTERNLMYALIAGIVVGVLLGLMVSTGFAGDFMASVARSIIDRIGIFGNLFLSSLKMIVTPLVLFSVTSGVATLGRGGSIGRRFGFVILYFLATSFLAVLIAIFYCNIVGPGRGVDSAELIERLPAEERESAARTQQGIAEKAPKTMAEFADTQIRNVLMNPFKSLAETNLVGVVAFALMLGLALASGGEAARPVIDFFAAMDNALMRIVKVVLWLAPLGVLALASKMLASLGLDVIRPLSAYFLTVIAGLATQQFIVFPAVVWIFARYNPWKLLMGLREVMLFAVSTSSSAATIPVTIREVESKLGVDAGSANFVIPMGATINMNGTALYEAAAAMFIAQLIGLELTLTNQLIVFLTATLAAIGAAGIPQAGLVTMVIIFNALGIPLEWMALIIVVDRPLDHLRTVVNVSGDAVGAVILSHRQGLLRRDVGSHAAAP
ncbi:cation:dicarboxylase symporter family transporter [bacterium]|nr:cation:dicarboxylase symporter family transporter [bacterium]